MDTRRPALWFALLALLPAAEAIASSTAPKVTAGEAQLALSSNAVSTFPIDVQALATALCGPIARPPITNMAKCRLVVPDPPTSLRVMILPPLSPASAQPVQWQVTGMNLAMAPAVTSCGTWNASLSLDAIQPTSPMILTPATNYPQHGHFTSTLQMRAHLHLANAATRQTVDYPLVLGLGLTGPWRLATAEEQRNAAVPGLSNLRVLNGDDDSDLDCLPLWVVDYPDLLKKYLALGCELCPDDQQ